MVILFGTRFDKWVIKCGFIIEKSLPHTQDQNGLAKRFRGVIIKRGRAIKNTTNLLEIL